MEPVSYESMHASLESTGFLLKLRSPYGSRLYAGNDRQYRVAHFQANAATRAWMERTGTRSFDVLPDGIEYPSPGDLPEFGLESSGDYHSDTSAVSKSMLSVFAASPLEYYHQFITGLLPRKKPTKQMKIGTAVHAVLLENKTIDEVCVEYPYSCIGAGGKLLSSKAKSFEERLHPLMAVRECDMSAIQQIVANARASEFGKLLELHSDRALFEKRFDAEIEGVPCKCKPDLLILLSDQAIICDLKVGVVKPDDFWRNAKNFGYSLQASHYSKIIKKVYGLPVTWRFWALESSFPYRVEPYWYEDRSMEIANDSHRDLLRKLKRCYDTGVWVDNFEHEKVLSPWDVSYKGESVTPEEMTDVSYEHTEYSPEELDM